ncbi:hypothetical protein ACJIZ3_012453 [Penstemon smallii]|uniref:Uncharacterized protein n=1 Tax=Penstemon smallii TaxID=265156 RepID=A0ABD3UNM4_9LAMI
MRNITSPAQQISLFRSRIQSRSFDDTTVGILESILVSKNVESLNRVRSALKQLLKDESLVIIREIHEESVEIKLLCTDFLVHLFALIGDFESCLALRYEALIMREQNTTPNPKLRVSYKEWLNFAEHSLENGFYSIANKACEKALMCSETNHMANPETDEFLEDVIIKRIKRLKDAALLSISSKSVQAQAAAYMKQKEVERSTQFTNLVETKSFGSSLFRNGIKKNNLRRLHDHQRL